MLTKMDGTTLVYSEDNEQRILGKGYYWINRKWLGSQLFKTEQEAIDPMNEQML